MKRYNFYLGRFLLLGVVVSGILLAGITLAFMFKKTGTISNDFVPAEVHCKVNEIFDGTKKTSIKVLNDDTSGSNIDTFIRVKLISYWVDDSGNIIGKASEMPAISYDSSAWIKCSSDSEYVYYHKNPVAAGDETAELLADSKVIELKDGEYHGDVVHQVVEVFAEAIQANPKNAAESAWAVTVTDNKISSAP